MPIVDVELVSGSGDEPEPEPELSRRLADAVGDALGSAPGGTWLRLDVLPADHYAENQTERAGTPAPVFVTVLTRLRPEGRELTEQIGRLTRAVASVMNVDPELVHVIYAESGRDRVAFGGRLVT